MTTIAYPYTRPFRVAALDWWLTDNVKRSESPMTGGVQTVEVPGARWNAILTLPAATNGERADVEGFFASVRRSNRLALWHLRRPEPRGTMRGSPTVTTTTAAMAQAVPISGSGTLLRGDMIGINGQLCMVTADATLPATVSIAPGLRAQATAGTAVVWDKPTALFLLTEPVRVRYVPGVGESLQVQVSEVFA